MHVYGRSSKPKETEMLLDKFLFGSILCIMYSDRTHVQCNSILPKWPVITYQEAMIIDT